MTTQPLESYWAIETMFATQVTNALRQGPRSPTPYSSLATQNVNGVALIEVRGILTKYPSFLQSVFGGVATTDLQDAIKAALADASVKGICLVVDSPGGGIGGIAECADVIFEGRKAKPTVVQVSGMLASAAYHFGSQATKIYASHSSDRVGSIGTMMIIEDSSGAAAKAGIEVFVASTGEFKSIGVPGVPLTDPAKAYLKRGVQETQAVFSNAVQRGRGLSANRIAGVSDGSMLSATEAVAYGLIDGIQSLETTLAQMQGTNKTPAAKETSKVVTTAQPTKTYKQQFQEGVAALKATGLDAATACCQFVKSHPEIHQAFLAEAAGRPVQSAGGQAAKGPGMYARAFRSGIDDLVAKGMPRHTAVCRFVRDNSELHRLMLVEARG